MASRRRFLPALIRAPVLHFVLLGGLLFALESAWQGARPAAEVALEPLTVTARQIEQAGRDFQVKNGFPPTPDQLRDAVEAMIDEELLYREALAIGLANGNEAIRRRLVQVARFVSDDPDQDDEALYQAALELGLDRSDEVVRRQLSMMMRLAAARTPMPDETEPDDSELRAYLQDHPDRFAKPWRARLTHVFVSEDRHGAAAEKRAHKLLDRMRKAGMGPQEAPETGDPFLLGHHLPWRTEQDLANAFGDRFAGQVAGLEPGVWSQPVASNFGWHLVWLDAVEPAAVPDLELVRDRVRAAVLESRQDWRLGQTLDDLRAGYRIDVEWPAGMAGDGAGADG